MLARRTASGAERTLARGVLGFDVGRDSSAVYTNGTTVFLVKDGVEEKLASEELIERVAVL